MSITTTEVPAAVVVACTAAFPPSTAARLPTSATIRGQFGWASPLPTTLTLSLRSVVLFSEIVPSPLSPP